MNTRERHISSSTLKRYIITIARRAGIVVLFLTAAVAGIATGLTFAYSSDVPQIAALDDYAPRAITRVYGSRGEIVGEFAIERREVVPYEAIPTILRQAILAAEDAGFEQHIGFSIPRIIITAINDVIHRRMYGASTLTQQLARHLFLAEYMREGRFEQFGMTALERKVKEVLVAIQIEKRYTKREIFTLYANQMYFGHGVYGIEAASQLYFGKSAKDLELQEAALIAGILQGNVSQSPYVNMDAALRRRNYTLDRMADVGFISREEADRAEKMPIVASGQPQAQVSTAPYFLEEVRKELESRYGAKQLYENGLSIQTGLDLRLQVAANEALDRGLRGIDKRRGFRKPQRNLIAEGCSLDKFRHPRWDRAMTAGEIVPAIVVATDAGTITLRAGGVRIRIDRKGFEWTGKAVPAQLVQRGDLVEVRLLTLDDAAHTATGALEHPPAVEGAIVVLDNHTGQIRAMVGGYRFERSQFNRATQAYRQVGSAFKPIVYAAAIDRGYTPTTILMDAPVSWPAGNGQTYAPQNYDHRFEGPITLRRALEESRNVPAVRVMDELGPKQVIAYARRLGLQGSIEPYLPVALGAAEATLLEMTALYATFPNQGVRMRPLAIERVTDRAGNVLEEDRPEPRDAIRADTAYVITNLLRGVVQHGTAMKAGALNWPVGGKTGTTDDYTDAWFIGFDPDITVGVWVGRDRKERIGNNMTGAEAALPIWIDVMKAWVGDRKEAPTFNRPGNIVFISIDKSSGEPTSENTPGAMSEAFIAGTEPTGFKQ